MIQTYSCTISDIQDEVQSLVSKGIVSRHQRLYTLCQYFAIREWQNIESLLEAHSYLLRDQVGDLLPCERWLND